MNLFKDILQFHERFGLDSAPTPSFLNEEMMNFRVKFMQEELDEFIEARKAGNLVKAMDALVDLMYVVLGTGYLMNLPIPDAWIIVHSANMKKIRAERPDDSKRGTAFDVIKPKGWESPEPRLAALINEYTETCKHENNLAQRN